MHRVSNDVRILIIDDQEPNLRLLERVLPDRIDPKVSMLIDALRSHVRLPGAGERKHFTYLIRRWCGRKDPGPDDYLRYAFEHAAFLGEPDLQAVLLVLRELGFSDVPAPSLVQCAPASVDLNKTGQPVPAQSSKDTPDAKIVRSWV